MRLNENECTIIRTKYERQTIHEALDRCTEVDKIRQIDRFVDLSVETEYLCEQRYFENLKFANSAENWQIAKRIGLVRPGNNGGECCFTQCTNVRIRVLTGETRGASDRIAESVVESL